MDDQLLALARKLLDTALEYRSLANQTGLPGAVIWVEDVETGEVVIVTRGEYKHVLLNNIPKKSETAFFDVSS
jgi:hypothetical protein